MSKELREILPEQLHKWYLEATAKLHPESYNPMAQKPYAELSEEQKFIDKYIAEAILALMDKEIEWADDRWIAQCEHNDELMKENIKLKAEIKNMDKMKISRVWSMPSIWTFGMKPIGKLFAKYCVGAGWVDPFAGEKSPAEHRNDIEGRGNPSQLDALEFLKTLPDSTFDGVLFDPPYSTEQCLRRYTPKHNGTAGRAEYWAKCKDEISRILKNGGLCISFCWDSVGIGANRDFEIEEILLICHGACHNDTIVTVDRKNLKRTLQ